MDVISLGFENFSTKALQSRQPVLILCMPRNLDFPSQAKALADSCQNWEGRVIPAVLDDTFMGAFKCRYGIKGTPTFLIFNNSEEQDRILGLHNTEELTDFLQESLGLQRAENVTRCSPDDTKER